MNSEPEAMRMIHEIQERLHRERRDWTDKELLEEYRRRTLEAAEKRGLRVAPLPGEAPKQRRA